MKGACPSCGSEGKFGVHLGMYRTNCFKCGYHDKPLYVVGFVEGLGYHESLNFLRAFEGLEYKEPILEGLIEKPLILPEGFMLLNQGEAEVAKAMRNYVRKRGLDPTRLSKRGFGYGVGDKYFGYLIMPYYFKGRLVYFTTRRVIGHGPKFDNPDIEDIGIGKSVLIYNHDAIHYYDHVYILESVLNAETLGDNSIALGGKKISKHQTTSLITSPCERYTIILDPDAYLEALSLGLKLVPYKRVKVVMLPLDTDANSLGRRETMLRVWKTRYMDYNDLLRLKKSYEGTEFTHN
jgi:hypothetical protein